jgi:hypothetical protein
VKVHRVNWSAAQLDLGKGVLVPGLMAGLVGATDTMPARVTLKRLHRRTVAAPIPVVPPTTSAARPVGVLPSAIGLLSPWDGVA